MNVLNYLLQVSGKARFSGQKLIIYDHLMNHLHYKWDFKHRRPRYSKMPREVGPGQRSSDPRPQRCVRNQRQMVINPQIDMCLACIVDL